MSTSIKHDFNDFRYELNLDPKDHFVNIRKNDEPEETKELFKYFELNKYSIDSLGQKYIYCSHPEQFNDPYDCDRNLISFDSFSLEEVLEYTKSLSSHHLFNKLIIKKLYESTNPEDKIELKKRLDFISFHITYTYTGILSLTRNIESMEMWSYYTNHQGYAINFDTKKLPKPNYGPFPINYAENFKSIDFKKFKDWSFIYQSNIKAISWKPEDEYRMYFFSEIPLKAPNRDMPGSIDRKFYYDITCVKEIILGLSFFDRNEYDIGRSNDKFAYVQLKTNKKKKRKVLYHILKNNIPVSMIRYRYNRFSLKPFRIHLTQVTCSKYKIEFLST